MIFPQGYHRSINATPQRMVASIISCFHPVNDPEYFRYSQSAEPFTLQIYCQKWGDIGQVVCHETQPGKTELRLEPPNSFTPNIAYAYEKLIRDECLGPRGRLAHILGQDDLVLATLSEALYTKRLERQRVFISWLLNRLEIYGYRDIELSISGEKSDAADKIDQFFDFPIQGTPAQFGVMIHHLTFTLRNQPEYQKLLCQVFLTGSKDAHQIPSDANPVEVKITLAKNQISFHAHLIPTNGSLLRINLKGEKNTWSIWDRIRDELEKLGWFALPEVSKFITSIEEKSEPQQAEKSLPVEIWLTIPNVGANRDIIRLWHQGLTCEQIATRVGLTGKTILNRINKLRKENGVQIVPYRKSNFVKKSKDRPT